MHTILFYIICIISFSISARFSLLFFFLFIYKRYLYLFILVSIHRFAFPVLGFSFNILPLLFVYWSTWCFQRRSILIFTLVYANWKMQQFARVQGTQIWIYKWYVTNGKRENIVYKILDCFLKQGNKSFINVATNVVRRSTKRWKILIFWSVNFFIYVSQTLCWMSAPNMWLIIPWKMWLIMCGVLLSPLLPPPSSKK